MKRINDDDIVKFTKLFKKYGFKRITCILLSLILIYSLYSNITRYNNKFAKVKAALASENIDSLEEIIDQTISNSDEILELFTNTDELNTNSQDEMNNFNNFFNGPSADKISFIETNLKNINSGTMIDEEVLIDGNDDNSDYTEIEDSKSNVEKQIEYILDRYDLTMFEFTSVVYVVFHEVYPDNYDDAYRVINLIYNRTLSKSCVDYVNYLTGLDGRSMYAQVIAPGQFIVYNPNEVYFNMEENYNTVTFQAILDFLTTEERIHDYLSYKAAGSKINGGMQFTPNGNVYHNLLQEDDLIDKEVELVRIR